MKEDRQLIIHCYSTSTLLERIAGSFAFKMVEVIAGGGLAKVGNYRYLLQAGDLLFAEPNERVEWVLDPKSVLHYCQIHPSYFSSHPHIVQLFQQHPRFHACSALTTLTFPQAVTIGMVFKMIRQEAAGPHEDKKQAILIHVQLLLLLATRADKQQPSATVRLNRKGQAAFFYQLVKPFLDQGDAWRNN